MLILGLGTSSLRCKILSSYPPKAPLSLFSLDTKPFLEGGQGDDDLLVKRRKEAAGNCSGGCGGANAACKSLPFLLAGAACSRQGFRLHGVVLGTVLFQEQHRWSRVGPGVSSLSAGAEPHLVWVWRDPVCWRDVWTLCRFSQGSMDSPLPPSAVQTGTGCVPCGGHDARAEMLSWLLASCSFSMSRGTEPSLQSPPVGSAPRSSTDLLASRCSRCPVGLRTCTCLRAVE